MSNSPAAPLPTDLPSPVARPDWAKFAGWAALAMGLAGVTTSGVSLYSFLDNYQMFVESASAEVVSVIRHAVWTSAAAVLVEFVLLMAGLTLVLRKSMSRVLSLLYAVGSAALLVDSLVQAFSGPAARPENWTAYIPWFLNVGASLLVPAVVLAWFLRPSVKQEMRSWR